MVVGWRGMGSVGAFEIPETAESERVVIVRKT
jgi:hypothetical protein